MGSYQRNMLSRSTVVLLLAFAAVSFATSSKCPSPPTLKKCSTGHDTCVDYTLSAQGKTGTYKTMCNSGKKDLTGGGVKYSYNYGACTNLTANGECKSSCSLSGAASVTMSVLAGLVAFLAFMK